MSEKQPSKNMIFIFFPLFKITLFPDLVDGMVSENVVMAQGLA